MTEPLNTRSALMLGRVLVGAAALTVLTVVTVLLIVHRAGWDAWAILTVGALVAGYGAWDERAR